jgi:hypothetical protein
MLLLPVTFPQGYGMRNASVFQGGANTSWGGNVLFDGKTYHLFLNTIANECLLGMWMRNSRIDHVVSDVITGPYTFKDTAIGMWSSNPAPVVLKSGPYRYAMFMIGNGTALPGIKNCSVNDQVPSDAQRIDGQQRSTPADSDDRQHATPGEWNMSRLQVNKVMRLRTFSILP